MDDQTRETRRARRGPHPTSPVGARKIPDPKGNRNRTKGTLREIQSGEDYAG